MKIIFYGTRDYDHLYFDVLAADPDYGCTIKFLAANLDPDTAQLAAGGDEVGAGAVVEQLDGHHQGDPEGEPGQAHQQ